MPPCLTLSNILEGSRVKWSNSGRGVKPFPTPRCSSYWKGSLLFTLDYGRQLYLLTRHIWRNFCKHAEETIDHLIADLLTVAPNKFEIHIIGQSNICQHYDQHHTEIWYKEKPPPEINGEHVTSLSELIIQTDCTVQINRMVIITKGFHEHKCYLI